MAKLLLPGRTAQPAAPDSQTASEPHTLLISIAHGDLRLAKYPLAVGHYHGDTIVHAEKRLDDQLDKRLTELFNMYLYPGAEGTVEVLHVPGANPPGALIIGLGNVGEITPAIVRNGITNAALRHALAVLNESRNESSNKRRNQRSKKGDAAAQSWVAARFSTLLLGTYGGNALSIEASVTAIVQGVIRANEALRSQKLWNKVRIDEVRLVELYEDVALDAARAATYLAAHPPTNLVKSDALQVKPLYLLPIGKGRTQRPIDPYSRGWWRRIRITSEKDEDGREGLRFLALTDRARAEETLQYTQREFIEEIVRSTVTSTTYAEGLATVLFKLLLPNSIKDQTSSESDLLLVLDPGAAQYPWELLAERTRNGVEPLAVRMGIIRQFQTQNFTQNPQPARERNALVIGAPKSPLIDLPSAKDEARMVADLLEKANYDIGEGPSLGAGSVELLDRLFAKGYKILHIAGHGKYVKDKPDETGVILDNGKCLSPIILNNLSPLPELVFINCCYLGKVDEESRLNTNSPHALAASLSQKLIEMGVKAVVAAGWAVEDKAAASFAETFYREMLKSQKFGMAVKTARIEAHKTARKEANGKNPGSNTWGAYQCYGNPDFVLESGGDSSESAQPPENRCYSRREYRERLEDIASDAARADAGGRDALCLQLETLNEALPKMWRDGAVLSAFGAAWAALGYFDRASKSYEEAILDEKAEAPLNAIEQLANMEARYADKLREQQRAFGQTGATTAGAKAQTPASLIDSAIERLNRLFTLGETAERLSLMGGCYKRKAAAAQTADEKRQWLKEAENYYGQAHLFNKEKLKTLDPYPTLNWLTYRFLLGESLEGDLAFINKSINVARKEEQDEEPSFWKRVTEPDAELLRHLIKGDLEERYQKIITLYRAVFQSGATPRELTSVIAHFDFIREMLSSVGEKSAGVEKNLAALDKVREAFASADEADLFGQP